MERTELVKQMLVAKGIDIECIDTSSHGEDNPVIKTDDESPEPRNRRVEVVVR
jgi:outer membrane protein OmpA-like peptidoglycan-associated protein